MAQVASGVQERIAFLLDHLTAAWRDLPEVEREIDRWDVLDQIDYIEEWSPAEALLEELHGLAASTALTKEQQARYKQLQRLIKENRPILDRLRAS